MNFPIDARPSSVRLAGGRPLAWMLSLLAHGALAWAVVAYSGVPAAGVKRQQSAPRPLAVYLKESTPAVSPAAAETAVPAPQKRTPLTEEVQPAQQEAEREPVEAPVVVLARQPEPQYFRSSELSERPHVVQDIPPDLGGGFVGVPAQAVILRLFINEEGAIDRVTSEESYLPPERMAILVEAFSKMKFRPGLRDGTPVKSQMRIEVRLESLLSKQ